MYGIAKKEGGSEELTHFTEGSFEDTVIITSFDSSSRGTKQTSPIARPQCSSLTSPVR